MTFPRQREPEWMDDPKLDPKEHRRALRALSRVNYWSGSAWQLWREIAPWAARGLTQPIRILDIACGGGDVTVQLASLARRAGTTVNIVGCDVSPVAISEATALAGRLRESNVEFRQLDVLSDPWPDDFDIVTCTLFLHHLDEPHAVQLLRRMGKSARSMVLVDDLRRTEIGYWMAFLGSRVLTRSPVVHRDGPLSVRGAWTLQEAKRMADQAGLQNASLRTHWPQRFLLRWSRIE